MDKILDFLDRQRFKINARLESVVRTPSLSEDSLTFKAAHYSLLGKGHRFRPLLTIASYRSLGQEAREFDPNLVLNASCVSEMIHASTLIFDDIMDGSDLRRGKPSTPAQFGTGNAQLGAIYLISRAFDIANKLFYRDEILAEMTKTINSMLRGQELDINKHIVDEESLKRTYDLKSARLMQLCGDLGFYCSDLGNPDLLLPLKAGLGYLAFAYQIRDDIADVSLSSAITGKPQGQDKGKITSVNLWGVEEAEKKAQAYFSMAKDRFSELPNDFLVDFTDYLSQPMEQHTI